MPDQPFGFAAAGYLGSGSYSGKTMRCHVDSGHTTRLGPGDVVAATGQCFSDGTPEVDRASTSDYIYGVIESIDKTRSEDCSATHLAASTAGYVNVYVDKDILFHVQEDSDGGNIPATSCQLNVNIVVTECSATTGRSLMEIDSSTVANTDAMPFRIVKLAQIPGNVIGNNAIWEVVMNESHFHDLTGE